MKRDKQYYRDLDQSQITCKTAIRECDRAIKDSSQSKVRLGQKIDG